MGLERVFQQPVAPSGITVKVLTLDQEPISVKLDINDTLAVAKVSCPFLILIASVSSIGKN